jgi:gluconate 2-dehydrogenase gamma chain
MASLRGLFSRRGFFQLGFLAGGAYLLSLPGSWIPVARPPRKGGKFLDAFELELCTAACERVLPRDHSPGAIDLGVPQFIDRWLDRPGWKEFGSRRVFKDGLRKLNDWSLTREGRGYLELPPDRQEALLTSYAAEGGSKGHRFVTELVTLTLEGTMCDPSYGGNKNRAGWELIGFDVPCPNPSCE